MKELMEYLNTIVYIKNGKLHTRPFSKPCDTHTYLIPSSCHATHTIKNIPYSIALTIYKIASEPAEYEKSKLQYIDYLTARGHNIDAVKEAFSAVEKMDRTSLYSIKKTPK